MLQVCVPPPIPQGGIGGASERRIDADFAPPKRVGGYQGDSCSHPMCWAGNNAAGVAYAKPRVVGECPLPWELEAPMINPNGVVSAPQGTRPTQPLWGWLLSSLGSQGSGPCPQSRQGGTGVHHACGVVLSVTTSGMNMSS